MHIVIAGNIGSGKTTLTRMLARHYGWKPAFEAVDHNPYIADYYHDIHRWTFNMEVFYLKERFKTLLDIAKSTDTIIQDRSIFEGVHVFMANNYELGNIDERDYQTFMDIFADMMLVVREPELMVYLRASVPHLVENIQKRGRDYEQKMPIEYLESLNRRYDDFIYQQYRGRKIVINVDNIDFEHNRRDFGDILDRIDGELFGLFHQ